MRFGRPMGAEQMSRQTAVVAWETLLLRDLPKIVYVKFEIRAFQIQVLSFNIR